MSAAVICVVAMLISAAAVEYLIDEWRLLVRAFRGLADDAP